MTMEVIPMPTEDEILLTATTTWPLQKERFPSIGMK